MEAKEKLKKAKVQLLIRNPFFASLILTLPLKKDVTSEFVMATDGVSLYYNPNLVNKYSIEELTTILAHEALHVILLHPIRRQQRDLRHWNIACDYAVNLLLTEFNFYLPPNALVNKKFQNKYAEEIYSTLFSQQQTHTQSQSSQQSNTSKQLTSQQTVTSQQSNASQQIPTHQQSTTQQSSQVSSPSSSQQKQSSSLSSSSSSQTPSQIPPESMGGVVDPPKGTDLRKLEADLKQKVAAALQAAKKEGKLPAALEDEIQQLLYPKLPWSIILRRFLDSVCRTDYTFLKPNKRLLYRKIILPSLYQQSSKIIIVIDTSGSLSEDELQKILSEIYYILTENINIEELVIIQADCEIQQVINLTFPFDLKDFNIKFKIKGRGGTDYCPVFNYISKHNINVSCLIYFTDLECSSYPSVPPPYPVLWICTQKHFTPPPFGEVLVLE